MPPYVPEPIASIRYVFDGDTFIIGLSEVRPILTSLSSLEYELNSLKLTFMLLPATIGVGDT